MKTVKHVMSVAVLVTTMSLSTIPLWAQETENSASPESNMPMSSEAMKMMGDQAGKHSKNGMMNGGSGSMMQHGMMGGAGKGMMGKGMMGQHMMGKHMMQKHNQVLNRLDLIDARIAKIETMLEKLLLR